MSPCHSQAACDIHTCHNQRASQRIERFSMYLQTTEIHDTGKKQCSVMHIENEHLHSIHHLETQSPQPVMGYDDCAERTNVVVTSTSCIAYTGLPVVPAAHCSTVGVCNHHVRQLHACMGHHSRKVPFCARWFTTALLVAATRVTTIFDIVPGFGETFAPRKRPSTGDARL